MDYTGKRVMIITRLGADALADAINDYLRTYKVVDIQYSTMVIPREYHLDIERYSAMIVYED